MLEKMSIPIWQLFRQNVTLVLLCKNNRFRPSDAYGIDADAVFCPAQVFG